MDDPIDLSAQRMKILEMIESGQISADEGLGLLAGIQAQDEEPLEITRDATISNETPAIASSAGAESAPSQPESSGPEQPVPAQPEILEKETPPDFTKWRSYWMIPVWIGVGIAILGSLLMSWAVQSSGFGFWFLCASVPFAIGVIVIVLGIQSRTAHWLHLRVQQAPGEHPERIAISFPIPIGLTIWFLRTFGHRIPGMENVPPNLDQVLQGVNDSTSPENPIYIEVDEGDDGEKVQIYIG